MKKQKALLDLMLEKTTLSYLSDLHQGEYVEDVQKALQSICPEQYQLEEWQEAASYILGEQSRFPSVKQTYRDLLQKLQAKGINLGQQSEQRQAQN